MYTPHSRRDARLAVHRRIRKKIHGTEARPRLAVYRSIKHIYAQLIDDEAGKTLVAASTQDKDHKVEYGGNVANAKAVGARVAERAKAAGINVAVFDRGGNRYHGRIKALAEGAHDAGLQLGHDREADAVRDAKRAEAKAAKRAAEAPKASKKKKKEKSK